jgi:hypothetical protein
VRCWGSGYAGSDSACAMKSRIRRSLSDADGALDMVKSWVRSDPSLMMTDSLVSG